jgi:hypothetical protein
MEAKKNFMIDMETLATTPNAVVRCISVIPFTLEREESVEEILGRQLTVWIQAQPQIEAGRALCEDTIAWWEKKLQSNDPAERAAAERIFAENADEVDPKLGLEIIAAYMLDEEPNGLIYSRGSNFDFPMFEDMTRQYGVLLPFSTWKITCSKSILRFMCGDDKEVEAGLVGGLRSNHDSAFDCAVEIKKLQALHTTLAAD